MKVDVDRDKTQRPVLLKLSADEWLREHLIRLMVRQLEFQKVAGSEYGHILDSRISAIKNILEANSRIRELEEAYDGLLFG